MILEIPITSRYQSIRLSEAFFSYNARLILHASYRYDLVRFTGSLRAAKLSSKAR
jgi:hypothetical protein